MTRVTSKCPHCGWVIRRQTNPVHKIGCPLERCKYCGRRYINSYVEEWITKSPIKRFFFFLQSFVWARAFFVPVFIIGILGFEPDIARILWPIFSVAWLIVGYFVHKNANKEAIEESLERTEDPEYVAILQELGFKIYPIK